LGSSAALLLSIFAVAAVGAYWSLMGQHDRHSAICLRAGVITGLVSSLLVAFPTGDGQGKLVTRHQPVTLAAVVRFPSIFVDAPTSRRYL
jgi:cytochrome d ubiquinol oxidase subunit I